MQQYIKVSMRSLPSSVPSHVSLHGTSPFSRLHVVSEVNADSEKIAVAASTAIHLLTMGDCSVRIVPGKPNSAL